jgi:hypothetical protein
MTDVNVWSNMCNRSKHGCGQAASVAFLRGQPENLFDGGSCIVNLLNMLGYFGGDWRRRGTVKFLHAMPIA